MTDERKETWDSQLSMMSPDIPTGRPLGSEAFVAALERDLGRPLTRRKPGPKPAARGHDQGR